jgi:hypothetical protein
MSMAEIGLVSLVAMGEQANQSQESCRDAASVKHTNTDTDTDTIPT